MSTVQRDRPVATAPRRWALVLTAAASFMVGLDGLVVTTALPALAHGLHAGVGALQWTVNAYALPCGAGIVPAAALGDRFGRRRVFALGLALFTLASGVCAAAPGIGWLLAGRAVQGLGAAAVLPLGLTLLTGAFPAERRGTVLGVWSGIGGLAVAVGPLVGGAIVQAWDWHGIFWPNLPVGVAVVVLARLRLPETRGAAVPVDWPGAVLLAVAVAACLAGLVRAGSAGWRSGATGALLAAGALLLGGVVVRERLARRPLLPPGLFRTPGLAAAGLAGLLSAGAVQAAVFLVPQFFQTAQGHGPLPTGVRMLPWTLAPLLVGPFAGAVSDRLGRSLVLTTGLFAQGTGLAWFAAVAGRGTGYGSLVGPLALAGLGIAMAVPTAASTALALVRPADLATASGAVTTLQRLGGALGVALAAGVFATSGTVRAAGGFVAGFRPALAVAACLSVAGAGCAATVRRRPRCATTTAAPSGPEPVAAN